ncbi:hypothetical protein N7540_010972 [Penicillium herquei]|nr:hypothetical protein N7540_010972 [Penicillium herquei]
MFQADSGEPESTPLYIIGWMRLLSPPWSTEMFVDEGYSTRRQMGRQKRLPLLRRPAASDRLPAPAGPLPLPVWRPQSASRCGLAPPWPLLPPPARRRPSIKDLSSSLPAHALPLRLLLLSPLPLSLLSASAPTDACATAQAHGPPHLRRNLTGLRRTCRPPLGSATRSSRHAALSSHPR